MMAVGAWIGSRTARAGPPPTASNGTLGAPAESPARTITFESVNGSRFSSFNVVLPTVRRAGFTETNAEASAWSTALVS